MALFTTMMDSVATLKRPAASQDSHGGTVQTFEVIAQGLPCSVQPSGAGIVSVASQRNSNVSAKIFFISDIGAVVNDIVTTTDQSGVLRTFQVRGFERGPYNRRLSPYFLDCEELK